MNYNNNNGNHLPQAQQTPQNERQSEWRCPLSLLFVILCFVIVATVMLTFTLTSSWVRKQESVIIGKQQQAIESLKEALNSDGEFDKLEILADLLKQYSYYSDKFDEETMLNEVLRAYVSATGDLYAGYFTEEEYEAHMRESEGFNAGIGVSFVEAVVVTEDQVLLDFQIIAVFKNSPAEASGLRTGDRIYAVEVDGEFQSIAQLGGYDNALSIIRGEVGETIKLRVLRETENEKFESIEFSIVRDNYTAESVFSRVSETDSKVGIIRISDFGMQTPNQFKAAVQALQAQGVEYFVFDIRYNPGGDVQSVRAVLSYLLDKGDLILSAVDNKGYDAGTIYAGAVDHTGTYAELCSVAPEEAGMFADLNMVVLCNSQTASAAEIFAAGLRDNKNVTIVGETTFGKGIIQHYISLSDITAGAYDGYVKMTTFAYSTACGSSYHGIGIAPTEGYEVALAEETMDYNFYLIPESIDNQLQKAIEAVKSK